LVEVRLRLYHLIGIRQRRRRAKLIFDLPGLSCCDWKEDGG
jgi:hypothetical protein